MQPKLGAHCVRVQLFEKLPEPCHTVQQFSTSIQTFFLCSDYLRLYLSVQLFHLSVMFGGGSTGSKDKDLDFEMPICACFGK